MDDFRKLFDSSYIMTFGCFANPKYVDCVYIYMRTHVVCDYCVLINAPTYIITVDGQSQKQQK